ncbi:MAG: tetratricopeptide repeat protein [Bryobacterales bacterium]|nr:tetratricopeptide repeat protein [Bryobacterales bacterium]
MKYVALFAACLLTVPLGAQQKQERDLKYEKDTPEPVTTPPAGIPRSYALVIGISQYQNLPEKLQLRYTERDADAIYSILISPEGGNFKAENVHKLTGARATLSAMRRELEQWLPSVAHNDDRVLIYFAGHGFVYQGKGYLAPSDFSASSIAGTGYPMDRLGEVIGSKIHAKWKVLLTDACHSGAISIPDDENAQGMNRALLDLNKSLFSLTASRDRERSFESADWGGGHGIFTYYVVKGMEGSADENRDGIVTADELAEYVHRNVREATKGQQNPTSERGSFDPNMLLSWVPSNRAPGNLPAPKFGTLVFETNLANVEVFLDGKSVGTISKGTPLRMPGLVPGAHTVKGVRMGYEPDGPREETVYPGEESTVTLKILIPRRRPRAAVDAFDKGLELYVKGKSNEDRKRAIAQFEQALTLDPTYSQAALYIARASRDLFDDEQAGKYFQKAIEIDPDYSEARSTYAGMLLDIGNVDESIRQLDVVTRREPNNAMALYLQAQAYRMKEMYPESIEAARKAIKLTPNNGEAHFWLAESLRMSNKFQDAAAEYKEYLRLTDFDSKLAGKINYYAVGFLIGMGRKKRAAQRDVWSDLRNMAYFGICDSYRKLNQFDTAIPYCQKALSYDPADAYVHYALGLLYAHKAQASGNVGDLPAALLHFRKMLDINPDLTESEYARKNIASIDALLKRAEP